MSDPVYIKFGPWIRKPFCNRENNDIYFKHFKHDILFNIFILLFVIFKGMRNKVIFLYNSHKHVTGILSLKLLTSVQPLNIK